MFILKHGTREDKPFLRSAVIGVTGRIQTRNYENQEGRRIYLTEVVADGFERLEKRDDTANRSNIEEQMPGYALEEDDFPL